ncbi:hypothetical protein BWD42_00005 [Sphingobacterium sp. CZ-UAM]|nr:hypothetical protein BWD42_00005 [Sphingobacterium sp. CZ-UAM]
MIGKWDFSSGNDLEEFLNLEYIAALLSHSIGSRNYPSSPAGRLQKSRRRENSGGTAVTLAAITLAATAIAATVLLVLRLLLPLLLNDCPIILLQE